MRSNWFIHNALRIEENVLGSIYIKNPGQKKPGFLISEIFLKV